MLAMDAYAHFDEWWGPYHYSRGWETMGDVITLTLTLTPTLTLTLSLTL